MRFVDAHAHLDFDAFDSDRSRVLERARAARVEAAVVPGVAPAQWRRARRLHWGGFPVALGVGLHPLWLGDQREQVRAFRDALADADFVGECGLDRREEARVDRELQMRFLLAQVHAARERELPVVLHVVQRHGALLGALAPLRGMVHAFTGGPELASRYVALGLHLSLGGAVTRPNARRARAGAAAIPADRLLLETDAPDQAPAFARQRRNEPANLVEIARVVAALRGESLDALAVRTTANAHALFPTLTHAMAPCT